LIFISTVNRQIMWFLFLVKMTARSYN